MSSCGYADENIDEVNSENEQESKTFELLESYIDSLRFLNSHCSETFNESFIKYGVWKKGTKTIESAVFYPDKNLVQNVWNENNGLFFSFLYDYNSEKTLECYFYDNIEKDFKPLHITEELLSQDTMFLVRLYFDGGISCDNLFIEGTNSSSSKKNGVFKRQVN